MLKRGEGEEGEEREADRKAGQGGGLHFPVLGREGFGRPIDARVRPGGTSATWAPCLAGGGVRRLPWKAS